MTTNKQALCTHETPYWLDAYQYDDPDTGKPVYERVLETRSTCEDVGVHRWKCSKCGKVGYYSSAARDFYENGVPNEIVEMGA